MSVTNQARKIATVEISQSDVPFGYDDPNGERLKAIRCDQAGVLTAKLNGGTAQTLNLLQGERLDWTGAVEVSTDATCRLTIFLT